MKIKFAAIVSLVVTFASFSALAGTVLQNVQGKVLTCSNETYEGLKEQFNFKVDGESLTVFANTVKGVLDTKVQDQNPLVLKMGSISDLSTIAFFGAATTNAQSSKYGTIVIELSRSIYALDVYEVSVFGSNAKDDFRVGMDF